MFSLGKKGLSHSQLAFGRLCDPRASGVPSHVRALYPYLAESSQPPRGRYYYLPCTGDESDASQDHRQWQNQDSVLVPLGRTASSRRGTVLSLAEFPQALPIKGQDHPESSVNNSALGIPRNLSWWPHRRNVCGECGHRRWTTAIAPTLLINVSASTPSTLSLSPLKLGRRLRTWSMCLPQSTS